MSDAWLSRTELLFGEPAMQRLKSARVAIFGLGGVGGYTAEALARSGIGALDLIDHDRISESNLNRQILALHSTVGQAKVDACECRLHDICPELEIRKFPLFVLPETVGNFDFSQYDFVVDAVDTVTAKLALIERATELRVPIISCMGTGNKWDPSCLRIADIEKTEACPLARVIRKELKARGIRHVPVLYSTELPRPTTREVTAEERGVRRSLPGSTAFVPPVAGLMIAAEVVRRLAELS